MKKFILFAAIVLSAMIAHAQCVANFSYSVSGNTVQVTNLSAGTTSTQWYFGDGSTSLANNPTHTYSSPGMYNLCLYAYFSDSSGVSCIDSMCQTINVLGTTSCFANFNWTVTGNTVQFNNTSTGTNSNQWWFGDGQSSYGTNPSHTYSSPGTYWVCLNSYYDDSLQITCADSACYQITIVDTTTVPPCNANFSYTINGNSVQFNNTSSGTTYYQWHFGDGSASQSTHPQHTYLTAGTYDVCMYAYYADSSGGFCSDTLCQTLTVQDSTVNTPCTADFTWTVSGNTVTFNNTSSGTNTNEWFFGDGGSSTATHPTHTYSSPGTYWVCLTSYYQDSLQVTCGDSLCYQITIQDTTVITPCNANFSYTIFGNTVQFNNQSAGTFYYNWHFGDGTASQAINPNHVYASPGTYDVCLYAYYSDSTGGFCADTICQLVTVQDSTVNTPCNADFTWTISGNTVQFNNTSTGTNSNQWSFGDGGYSYANNPTHTYSSPGTYWVCLYSYFNDSLQVTCADSLCYQITIIDSLGGTGCSTSAITTSYFGEIYGANTSTAASQYFWSVHDYYTGNLLTTSTASNLSYTPNYNGLFTVCLTAYDSIGSPCDTTICQVVYVNDSLDSTATVKPVVLDAFELFPNPATTVLNVKMENVSANTYASIIDLVGREMTRVELTTQLTEISVIDLPSGVYMIRLIDAEQRLIGMRKFVRQ